MGMQVVQFDPAKKRPREGNAAATEQLGVVLSFDRLSEEVVRRLVLRQARRELEHFNFVVKVTGGYWEMYPSEDQIQAFYDEGLEY